MRLQRPRRGSPPSTESQPEQTPLDAAHRFVIPISLARFTVDVLADAGRSGNEAFVVWGAVADGKTVRFQSALVPDQQPHRTHRGLLVTVPGAALFAVNKTLYERGEVLAGQVHSHPTDAFHSDTDDCHSLVTLTGAISVVVPNFARDGLDGVRRWAWYRLTGTGRWSDLTRSDKVELRHDEDGA